MQTRISRKNTLDLELLALSVISERPSGTTGVELCEIFDHDMTSVMYSLQLKSEVQRYEGGYFFITPVGKIRLQAATVTS